MQNICNTLRESDIWFVEKLKNMTRSQIAAANFFAGFFADKKVIRPKRLIIWAMEIEEYVRFKRIKTENGFLYFWVGIGLRRYTDSTMMLFTSTTKKIAHDQRPELKEVCNYWFQCGPLGGIKDDGSKLKLRASVHDSHNEALIKENSYLINFDNPTWVVKSELEKLLVQWYEAYSKTQKII